MRYTFLIMLAAMALLWQTAQAADITVSWDAPTTYEDGSALDPADIDRYWVSENSSAVATVSDGATSTILTGRAPGNYCYSVQTVVKGVVDGVADQDIASGPSEIVCVDVVPPDTPRPNAPTGVTVTVSVTPE